MPWDEATLAKHKAAKEAPSALNAVVVPNMTLPKVRDLEQYILAAGANRCFRMFMTGSTSGARRASLKLGSHVSDGIRVLVDVGYCRRTKCYFHLSRT